MLPDNLEDVLNGACFVVNLDRAINRWPIIKERVENAGFKPERFPAIDGSKGHCKKQWLDFGTRRDAEYIFDSDGQAGCGLSHANIWDHIVKNNIPFASVFEDDVLFHKDWKTLSPLFYQHTDKNIDIVHYGCQGTGGPASPLVTSVPVFCTHAYLITLEGAKKMVNTVRESNRVCMIDCFIIELMKIRDTCPFTWQSWNATSYGDPARHSSLEYRNDGLVYQDDIFESNIHCHAPPELKDWKD